MSIYPAEYKSVIELLIKRTLGVLLVAMLAVSSFGREPGRGYRGFVEVNDDMTFKHDYSSTWVNSYVGLSTTHGYQFNSHYYLGAGVMYELVFLGSEPSSVQFPIFLQGRTDWTFGRFPLFADLRVGCVLFGEYRFYMSPTVGYRLNMGRKANFNFGLGMNFRGLGWSDEKTLHPQLSIRIGVDF